MGGKSGEEEGKSGGLWFFLVVAGFRRGQDLVQGGGGAGDGVGEGIRWIFSMNGRIGIE